jgi:transcriptional pleiotropic repressor
MNLLEKTRRINRLLQKSAGTQVDFNEMAQILSELIDANVYVASRKGKLLGVALIEGDDVEQLHGAMFTEEFNARLMKLDETTSNEQGGSLTFLVGDNQHEVTAQFATYIPVVGGGERLGTLVVSRATALSDEDLILGELGATVVGTEILRAHSEELEEEARKKAAVQIALGTLSYSELEAVQHIFDELEGNSEGLLVASKIADRVGITRSVIVNALRKFESAGVIESRSLGMKGTHIKVLNDRLVEELRKLR